MQPLRFEPDLDYQLEAIESVCDLFRGQEIMRTEFTVMRDPDDPQLRLGSEQNDLGIGNRLTLLDEELLVNLNAVQARNGLAPSTSLESGDFTVEMETGTGKTYVYLRTVLELNRRYGFTKFVIVVPSIAIREGVNKTIQMAGEHLKGLYGGVPFTHFIYDSSRLSAIRSFATSAQIQIMIVTVGAINREDNNIYKPSEKTGGERPIDLIKATRPIVIVDEPQSVDGGIKGAGKRALDAMEALCTLRYSATHVDKHHMVFRLDAVDAYERRLVKQIEVAAATIEEAHNRPFVRLVATKKAPIAAQVEIDVQGTSGVKRTKKWVQDGDDLEQTTGRAIYAGFRVGEIRSAKNDESVEIRFDGGQIYRQKGEAYGEVEGLLVQREMIRRTIREHLDKELRLRTQGIKVLSLFFIDKVDRYRQYDADGEPLKGDYASIFEEEYTRHAQNPRYSTLFAGVDLSNEASAVHGGYFSIDKKSNRAVDTKESNKEGLEAAQRAYELIMREKEQLLALETPLKFIFSHSALREGWDNPNVFQICTLRDVQSERERRQTIGRGLRLCVNQEGDRVRDDSINTLTVVATESYEQFAAGLQKEIEEETGIRFGVIESDAFAGIRVLKPGGVIASFGHDRSEVLWTHLRGEGYLNAKGEIQDSLRTALKEESVSIPESFSDQQEEIVAILRRRSGRFEVKNADERTKVRLRRAVLESSDFKALWNRIKHKTTYRVEFDSGQLIEDCAAALKSGPPLPKARLVWRKAGLSIGKSGVEVEETGAASPVVLQETDIELPDILAELQDRTQLTRRSLRRILIESERLHDFKMNPQAFTEIAATIINTCKVLKVVDGIKYLRIGDSDFYAQELFETHELTGYLKNMIVDPTKSVYDHVVYDSGVEERFAKELEKSEDVKLYAKLPGWFKIPTPLGSYNPDWAVLVERDGVEQLYFVVETKSSLFGDDLRRSENAKIQCGKAHFAALAAGEDAAKYVVSTSVEEMLMQASGT